MRTFLKKWYYILGLVIGVLFSLFGIMRISISMTTIRDPYTVHFMNLGLLYLQISLLIFVVLIVIAIVTK